jgi:hypothetical protein
MEDRAYQPYQSQYSQLPAAFVCPFCRTTRLPSTWTKTSVGGWILLVILALSCIGLPVCWLGLFLKDEYKVCSDCGIKLG